MFDGRLTPGPLGVRGDHLGLAGQHGPHSEDVLGGVPQRGQPGGLGLQRGPDLQDVPHAGALHAPQDGGRVAAAADEGALALPGDQHAGVHQYPDRLADGVAPDLEPLGQLVLGGDPGADRPGAAGQLLTQLLDRGVDQGALAGGVQAVMGTGHGVLLGR